MPSLSGLHFSPDLPYWQDYLPFLQGLAGPELPSCPRLNAMLPADLCSAGGHAIRFVASGELADDNYEQRIYTTGLVSTRPQSWHDLFNALVWLRYPLIKTALNRLHYQAGAGHKNGERGPVRDALTLFDECGVIVISDRPEVLQALAERRWRDAFLDAAFDTSVWLSVIGHALLEKYLSPYKAMTAKALLLQVDSEFLALPRQLRTAELDRQVAELVSGGVALRNPACLSPLPLAGVPGWWPRQAQNDGQFYLDREVFRQAPAGLKPAPLHRLAWRPAR